MAISLNSPADIQEGLRERFRKRRLALNLTQEGVARRSGVTLPSLRRFERTGLVALESLLKIALVLDCLGDFEKLAADDPASVAGRSLDDVLAQSRGRRKGRIK